VFHFPSKPLGGALKLLFHEPHRLRPCGVQWTALSSAKATKGFLSQLQPLSAQRRCSWYLLQYLVMKGSLLKHVPLPFMLLNNLQWEDCHAEPAHDLIFWKSVTSFRDIWMFWIYLSLKISKQKPDLQRQNASLPQEACLPATHTLRKISALLPTLFWPSFLEDHQITPSPDTTEEKQCGGSQSHCRWQWQKQGYQEKCTVSSLTRLSSLEGKWKWYSLGFLPRLSTTPGSIAPLETFRQGKLAPNQNLSSRTRAARNYTTSEKLWDFIFPWTETDRRGPCLPPHIKDETDITGIKPADHDDTLRQMDSITRSLSFLLLLRRIFCLRCKSLYFGLVLKVSDTFYSLLTCSIKKTKQNKTKKISSKSHSVLRNIPKTPGPNGKNSALLVNKGKLSLEGCSAVARVCYHRCFLTNVIWDWF